MKTLPILAAAALALTLSACSSSAQSREVTFENPEEFDSIVAEAADGQYSAEDTHTYPDGLEVSVSGFSERHCSGLALPKKVAHEVTVTNPTDAPIESGVWAQTYVGAGGQRVMTGAADRGSCRTEEIANARLAPGGSATAVRLVDPDEWDDEHVYVTVHRDGFDDVEFALS